MKAFFRMLMCAATLFAVGMSQSCTDDDTKDGAVSMSVEVKAVEIGAATLTLNTSGITEAAYKFYETAPESAPQAVILFQSGEKVACVDGSQDIRISGLKPATTYQVYIAGQTAVDYYPQVLNLEFTTADASDVVNIVSVEKTGYQIFLNLPAEVKERGNVIRYAFFDIFWYTYLRDRGFTGNMPLEDAALFSGSSYFGDDEDNVLIVHNMDNLYAGEDEDGEQLFNHAPIAPGEPVVMILGEHTGENWERSMFNPEGSGRTENYADDAYWTGYHSRTRFTTEQAEVLDATIKVEITDIGAIDATITMTPDPEVSQYNMILLDDATYKEAIALLGDESLLQWFLTSYTCANHLGTSTLSGKTEMRLKQTSYIINPETKYHILSVGMSGQLGSPQCFIHETFTTTEKQLPAPEVVVTAIPAPDGNDSPFAVWFNVKCPTKDAVSGYFAANTVREWEMALNSSEEMTNRALILNGYSLSGNDLRAINSDAGADYSFSTTEGESIRLGIMLGNEEQTYNDPDIEGSTAIAEATASYLEDKERVESELFTLLEGDWTLSGKVKEYDYDEKKYVYREAPMKTKVTISNGVKFPETLTQDVYDVYAGLKTPKTKEETDELYAEFKREATAYNKRLRGQNRILCVGFNSEEAVMAPMSAYEGFYFTDYNSYDIASIFYDFGPKWYFEVRNGDRMAVPVNSAQLAPMSNWRGFTCYMGGLADDESMIGRIVEANNSTFYFPVTVSDDKKTITIKSYEITVDGEKYVLYPNAFYDYDGQMAIADPTYVSELTLTYGWTEPEKGADTAAQMTGRYYSVPQAAINAMQMPKAENHMRSRTSFEGITPATVIEVAPTTMEDLRDYVMRRAGVRK